MVSLLEQSIKKDKNIIKIKEVKWETEKEQCCFHCIFFHLC